MKINLDEHTQLISTERWISDKKMMKILHKDLYYEDAKEIFQGLKDEDIRIGRSVFSGNWKSLFGIRFRFGFMEIRRIIEPIMKMVINQEPCPDCIKQMAKENNDSDLFLNVDMEDIKTDLESLESDIDDLIQEIT